MQTSCQGAKMSSKVSKQILCHFIKRYLEVALLFEGFFFLAWHIFSCFLIWGICIKASSGSGGNLNGQFESWESKMQGFFISKFLGIFVYEIIANITPVLCVLSAEKVPLGKAKKHVVLSCNTPPSNSTWDNVLFPKHKGKKEVPPVLPAILDFYNYIWRHISASISFSPLKHHAHLEKHVYTWERSPGCSPPIN